MLQLLRTIRNDLASKANRRYGASTPRALAKVLLADGTFAMVVYRLMQAAHRQRLGPLAMIFNKINVLFGGCIIGRGADFGEGFVLLHSTGTVINSGVRGGRNIFLEHQVTIGTDEGESPVLGDEVYVGAGAKILGTVRVGSGVRVGANAVVVHDVPDGSTVVGIPARVVRRREPEGPRSVRAVTPGESDSTGQPEESPGCATDELPLSRLG
jgi:serine O-acetyltransferase